MSGRSRKAGVLVTVVAVVPLTVGAFVLGAASATSGITAPLTITVVEHPTTTRSSTSERRVTRQGTS